MGKKAHQHLTPRFLLRRFAVDDHVAWIHRTQPPKVIGTRAAAVQQDFYSFRAEDGVRSTEIEDFLANEVDSPAAALIDRLARMDEEVQLLAVGLAKFLAFQVVRTGRFRDLDNQIDALMRRFLAGSDAVSAAFGDDSGRGWDQDEVDRLFDEVQSNPPPEYLTQLPPTASLRIMLRKGYELQAQLADLKWAIAYSETDVFCTSDNPVLQFQADGEGGFRGVQPHSGTEVRFALDPRHLLVGAPVLLGPDRFRATTAMIESTNRGLAADCHYAVFHRPGTVPPGINGLASTVPRLAPPTVTIRRSLGGAKSSMEYPDVNDPRIRSILERTISSDEVNHYGQGGSSWDL